MAYLRVTPTTALQSVRQIAEELARLIKDAGGFPASQNLQAMLNGLEAYSATPSLEVDLVLAPEVGEGLRTALRVWIHPDLADAGGLQECPNALGFRTLRVTRQSLDALLPRRPGVPRAPVLVLGLGPGLPDEDLRGTLEGLVEDRPLVLLAVADGASWGSDLQRSLQSLAWQVEVLDLDARPAPGLLERFKSPPWEGVLDLLKAHAAVLALDGVSSTFVLALDQEERGFKVKRAMAQQRANEVQQGPAPGARGNESVQEIKSRLNRQFTDFVRGVEDRWRAFVAPQQGALWRELDAALDGLAVLAKEEQVHSTVSRVPPDFEERLLGTVRDRLAAFAFADLQAMKDLFRLLGKDCEEVLTEAGCPPLPVQFIYLSDDRWRALVQSHLYLERRHQGEMPKHGIMEYITAARQYQTMVFMVLSAFGLGWVRQYPEFVYPASVILLGLGTFTMVKRVKRERIENDAKDLAKAREALRGELKRILNETHRGWLTQIDQHLKDQSQNVLGQVDSGLRDFLSRRSTENLDEKQRVQRQLQSLETLERRVHTAAKGRDQIAASLSQFRGECKQLVLSALNAPPSRYPTTSLRIDPGTTGAR